MKKFILIVFFLSSLFGTAQTPSWAWEKGQGGQPSAANQTDVGYNVITDASGSVYSIGFFQTPTLVIGTYTLTNSYNIGGNANLFIAKYDAVGNVLWAKSISGAINGSALGITIDAANNIYITGGYESQTIAFDSQVLTKTSTEGLADIFIAKYNNAGNIIWAKSYGGTQDDYGNAITTDAADNIYITGNFSSTAFTIDTYTLTNDVSGNPNMFVAKFDSSGNSMYAKSVGQSCSITITGNNIISDNNNNIYITGAYNSSKITIGNDTLLCNSNSFNSFIVKYDALGNVLWANDVGRGVNYSVMANDIALDALGNPYIAGNFAGYSLIIANDTLVGAGYSGFMAKFSASGNAIWGRNLKTLTADLNSSANHIAANATNGIYVGGSFINQTPPIVFGNDTLIDYNPGNGAIYIAKFDSSGNALWGKTAKSIMWNEISELTLDKYGNIYAVGSYVSPTLVFDNDTLFNSNPGYVTGDYFIAKIGTVGVGIEKHNTTDNVIVYPNPSSGSINITSTSNIDNIKVTDILGQTVYEAKPNSEKTALQLNNRGVYFITITNGKEVNTKKIIVNN